MYSAFAYWKARQLDLGRWRNEVTTWPKHEPDTKWHLTYRNEGRPERTAAFTGARRHAEYQANWYRQQGATNVRIHEEKP